jgi:hypothetical protein
MTIAPDHMIKKHTVNNEYLIKKNRNNNCLGQKNQLGIKIVIML